MMLELMTLGEDGDTRTLMSVDWPAVPRRGDKILLRGPEYGEGTQHGDEETLFEVHEVWWRDGSEEDDELAIEVLLTVPADSRFFVPNCTCEPEECTPKKDEPTRCDECNGRITARHRVAAPADPD